MLRKFWSFTKSQNNKQVRLKELVLHTTFLSLLLPLRSVADHECNCKRYIDFGSMPTDNVSIELKNNRTVEIKKRGMHRHVVILRESGTAVWRETYSLAFDLLWNDAFFVYIKPKKFYEDLDGDGFEEIAIAIWEGGQVVDGKTVVIFSAKKDRLEYFAHEEFHLEYDKYVLE